MALQQVEIGKQFYLIAEVGGKVVANLEISRGEGSYDSHVGGIGIAIGAGFRNAVWGTEMMRALTDQGRNMGLKVLALCAFSTNLRAIHVYEQVGFVKTGTIPRKFFRGGKYVDEVVMTLQLE